MTWASLPANEMARIADVYRSGNTEALQREAAKLGMKRKTLVRQVQQFMLYARKLANQIPASPTPLYNDFTVLQRDRFVILSDVEVPDHDPWMLRAVTLTGVRLGIKTLIWNGDVIATDQDALNSWSPTVLNDDAISYERAVSIVRTTMNSMAEQYQEQYFVLGNHDDRVGRVTNGHVQLAMFLRDTPVSFSLYRYMYVFSPRLQEWIYIAHPQNYSKDSGKLARQMYHVVSGPNGWDNNGNRIQGYNPLVHGKNKSKCHIILGHTHLAQEGWSEDGNFRCVALGCTRDPARTHYKAHGANKYPEWNQAFGVWDNGEYRSLSKFGTNWREFLGDDLYQML